MCSERPKTDAEEKLDEIIEHTDAAGRHLRQAEQVARQAGDKDGAKELAEEAEAVEKTKKQFMDMRDKKMG